MLFFMRLELARARALEGVTGLGEDEPDTSSLHQVVDVVVAELRRTPAGGRFYQQLLKKSKHNNAMPST
jgi:hypothetical protein